MIIAYDPSNKVFESVILNAITTVAEGDEMQFGFKSGLSTVQACVLMYWKVKTTVDYYTTIGIVMYSVALSISAKHSTALIIGSFLVI